MKKSLLKASFEESLNLEDDGFLQFQKKDINRKLEKYFKGGKPTIWLTIQNIILTLLFPIGINFLFLALSIFARIKAK